jgi:hypothetical protein
MNREELNWLLQTIKDDAIAKRFVMAQYEHGRISLKVMADVGWERGWINPTANQYFAFGTRYTSDCAATEMPIAAAG